MQITKNYVIRVAQNKGQENHADNCPKSKKYEVWAAAHQNGLLEITEDGKLCFNITIPSGQSSSSSSSSSSNGPAAGAKLRANTVDLVISVCSYAWQKQTYSIKKNIRTCRQEGRLPDWNYKSFDDFTRLFFGVTNEIDVYWRQAYHKLSDLCYRADTFSQADHRDKFLIYAKIEKLTEWKDERKYQYVTLRMKGFKNANKAAVRIPTDP